MNVNKLTWPIRHHFENLINRCKHPSACVQWVKPHNKAILEISKDVNTFLCGLNVNICAPRDWNELPMKLREADTIEKVQDLRVQDCMWCVNCCDHFEWTQEMPNIYKQLNHIFLLFKMLLFSAIWRQGGHIYYCIRGNNSWDLNIAHIAYFIFALY